MERKSLQDLTQWLKEVSVHLKEVQEKVNNLPQQVGKARVQQLALRFQTMAGLELAWVSKVAVLSHLGLLHIPHFR